jgi:hypothetical protein
MGALTISPFITVFYVGDFLNSSQVKPPENITKIILVKHAEIGRSWIQVTRSKTVMQLRGLAVPSMN